MSAPAAGVGLVRALTLRDLVLFNLVAILGLRWLATSARAGPAALTLWLLAALLFFVPQGIAVVHLSRRYPASGGLYHWTRETFGEAHGFFCGWCYWVCNVMYYPSILISTATIATFIAGDAGRALADDLRYVLGVTLAALWGAVLINIIGVARGRWLQNLGGIGTYLPGLILVALGVHAMATRPSATPFGEADLLPSFRDAGVLNLWSSIAFAYAGLELSSTMGDEVRDPARTLPRAVLVAAPLIAAMYVLGTLSLLWLVPPNELNLVSGFQQGIAAGAAAVGGALWWLSPLAAIAYTLGNVGTVGAWLAGPARVGFAIGLDRYFPESFGRVHPRWRTPWVAMLVQAILATLFLGVSLLGRGTTIEDAYLILLLTQLLVYFIPYLYLFACLAAHARRERGRGMRIPGFAAGVGFLMTLFAMVLAAIPTGGEDPLLFELKVVGGALFFVAIGVVIYLRARRRDGASP